MAPPLKIKWKYCECGCKSSAVTILGLHFSYYDPLDSKRPYLFAQTHNARTFGRAMPSFQTINEEVRRIVLAHKADIQEELAEMEAG
jgi:hypothetical protein